MALLQLKTLLLLSILHGVIGGSDATSGEHSCGNTAEGTLEWDDSCSREEDSPWVTQGNCKRGDFGGDSFVCVCSGSSCDFPGAIHHPTSRGKVTTITSSRASDRFHVAHGTASTKPAEGSRLVVVNPDFQYQKMLGFGGAFSDAAAINILSLSPETQDTLIRSYFSSDGIHYNIGRIPIGGSDFSTRTYSYDDVDGDVDLKHFALTEEDLKYKIPVIKRARAALGDDELYLLAAPWSPPAWMKTNGRFNGSGSVIPDLWKPYANYIIKFLQAYQEQGLNMWGLATQNEPLCGEKEEWAFNTCVWLAPDMRNWIVDHLGPALHENGFYSLKVLISDQIRKNLLDYTSQILESREANNYVDGFGVHWYSDSPENVGILTRTATMFPDKFLLYTEACEGFISPPDERVMLGDWTRAETYAHSIIETSNHHSSGWVDWNLALDMEGGPNWSNNFVDAPIIVDKDEDSFYKQPMFYALGHFSKFVPRDAKVVYNSLMLATKEDDLTCATYLTDNGQVVAVFLNTADEKRTISLKSSTSTELYYNLDLPPKSIQTVLISIW